jgi:hypothetical protein
MPNTTHDRTLTRRINTIPPLPQTGYSKASCFAKALHDCSSKISGEHYITEAVLKIIQKGDAIRLSGTHWLSPEEERKLPLKALATKILCERHNQALSGLDEFAVKFFRFLIGEESKPNTFTVNGDDLERWMLKVLCGFIFSRNTPEKITDWLPPESWLRILFGNDPLPDGTGLYHLMGEVADEHYQIALLPLPDDKAKTFVGLRFQISGFLFLFLMTPLTDAILKFTNGMRPHYRPSAIHIRYPSFERVIHFSGQEGEPVFVVVGN